MAESLPTPAGRVVVRQRPGSQRWLATRNFIRAALLLPRLWRPPPKCPLAVKEKARREKMLLFRGITHTRHQERQATIRPKSSQADPYDPFFIPNSILLHSPVSPQTQSKFLQLPPELLTTILQNVNIPYFQVCLALTCKTMARVAAQKNVLSPWRGFRDKDGLYRLLERKNNYIPPHLKLCRACFRFLPRDQGEYWNQQMEAEIFDRAFVSANDVLSWFHSQSSYVTRCPWCCALKYALYASETRYDSYELGERLQPSECMCLELKGRIDRP